MSVSLPPGTRAIVLDVEGTTTPARFVYQVLFPYARAHAAAYLERAWALPECRAVAATLCAEHARDAAQGAAPPPGAAQDASGVAQDAPGVAQDFSPALVLAYAGWLMDRDRKSPGLKALQGLVWQDGFTSGELRGEVYPDVPPALERWRARGLEIYIYSSGSVLAQQLLFGSTGAGDLTAHLNGYFDTGVGPKTSPESYRAIAGRIGLAPSAAMFVSDAGAELDAARAAAMQTVLCIRDEAAAAHTGAHLAIRTFDELP